MTQIAVQMFTVRELVKDADGFAKTLEQVAEIGYPAVQLSAIGAMNGDDPEVDAAGARKLLDANGLQCIATHRPWENFVTNLEAEIEFHKTLGCDYTAIGGVPKEIKASGNVDDYRRFVDQATPVIAKLKEAGIRFGYHNHAYEFTPADQPRKTCYDVFIDEADADLWFLELDVYWCQHAGVNAERLFERSKGRVPVIHVKDKEVVDGEPIIGAIGEGTFDWEHLIPAGNAAGVEWWAVEQDRCRRDPVDCLRASYAFLTQMGLKGRK